MMEQNSQRTEGFKGGIQSGSSSYDDLSRKMNIRLTKIKKTLATELLPLGYSMKVGIDGSDHSILHRGMSPDGGIWFDPSGKAICAFETKKQGIKGNAHERWFKNYMFVGHIYSGIRYVTFLAGEGCDSGMASDFKTLMEIHNRKFDVLYPDGPSFFSRVDGFTDSEICEIMRKGILQ